MKVKKRRVADHFWTVFGVTPRGSRAPIYAFDTSMFFMEALRHECPLRDDGFEWRITDDLDRIAGMVMRIVRPDIQPLVEKAVKEDAERLRDKLSSDGLWSPSMTKVFAAPRVPSVWANAAFDLVCNILNGEQERSFFYGLEERLLGGTDLQSARMEFLGGAVPALSAEWSKGSAKLRLSIYVNDTRLLPATTVADRVVRLLLPGSSGIVVGKGGSYRLDEDASRRRLAWQVRAGAAVIVERRRPHKIHVLLRISQDDYLMAFSVEGGGKSFAKKALRDLLTPHEDSEFYDELKGVNDDLLSSAIAAL